MIEGIKDLGELVEDSGEGFADLLIRQPKINTKNNKDFYVVGINFNLQTKSLEFRESVYSSNSPREFVFVGNSSANTPKNKATVSGEQVKYFFTQTLPLLRDEIQDKRLSDLTDEVLSTFFVKKDESYRFNIKNSNIYDEKSGIDADDLMNKKKDKDFLKGLLPLLYKKIEQEKGVKKNEIALFTLMLNGEYVAKRSAYKQYIANDALEGNFKSAKKGTCYVCGNSDTQVTANTTAFKLKYYITDKINFASGLEKENFIKNLAICKDCYRKILEGEVFLENYLQSRIFGLTLYIIPKFVFRTALSRKDLRRRTETIKYFVTSPNALENYEKFKNQLSDDMSFKDEKNNYMFDLLLVKKTNSAVKINSLIKDVPPSRIDTLVDKQRQLSEWAQSNLSPSEKDWHLTFNGLYYLFPVHKRVVDKFLVNIYTAIMEGKEVSYRELIDKFVEVAKVNAYEITGQYNINGNLNNLHTTILKQNLFLEYLKELNLLEGGDAMDVDKLDVKKEVKEFLREMGYDEQKTALFLIGYLVGEVGSAQFDAGMKNKPVLKKIVYQGMSIKRIVPFVNELFEKLIQYDKLRYNEQVFASAKSLLDKNINNWKLSDKENVFYILSGYSFDTLKRMTSSQGSSSKEESLNKN